MAMEGLQGLLAKGAEEWRSLNIDLRLADLHPALWFGPPNSLPVGGLDVVGAQDVLYALRAAEEQQHVGAGVADAWLRAMQCAQLAQDRLLHDLQDVDRNLSFWQRQVAAGGNWSHSVFMLLSRGPASFAGDVAVAARRLRSLLREYQAQAQALPQGQQPAGSGATRSAASVSTSTAASAEGPCMASSGFAAASSGAGPTGSATDMMQRRVLLLRALRTRLARALAQVTEAAAELNLGAGRLLHALPLAALPLGFAAAGGSTAGAAQMQEQQAVEEAVRSAVRGMRAALEGLLAEAAQGEGEGQREAPHTTKSGGGAGGGGRSPPPPPLSAELRGLLDLLRLQPLAARVVGCTESVEAEAEAGTGGAFKPGPGACSSGGGCGMASPSGLELTSSGSSARWALGAARRAAALSGPLVALPASARMPSRFQRHWLRYAAAAAALLYSGLFLLRHSRLAGSNDLDRWLRSAACAVRSALSAHVAEPLAAVRDELFRTFRDRPSIVSSADFEASRDSLLRMLDEFAADQGRQVGGGDGGASASPSSASAAGAASGTSPAHAAAAASADGGGGGGGGDDALLSGMGVLMRSYEAELRQPLRGLLLGDLGRALLIQVQHVKVDGEAAMLRLDQVLRANELSISLMAALPALGVSVLAAVGLARLLIPHAPDPRREALPSRLAMAALEVALERLAAAEEAQGQGQVQEEAGQQDEKGQVAAAAAVEELRGLVVYRTHRVYCEVCALYARADRSSRFSEWRPLHDDLLRLAAAAAGARERLATHGRMMRTYSVFQR